MILVCCVWRISCVKISMFLDAVKYNFVLSEASTEELMQSCRVTCVERLAYVVCCNVELCGRGRLYAFLGLFLFVVV